MNVAALVKYFGSVKIGIIRLEIVEMTIELQAELACSCENKLCLGKRISIEIFDT